MVEIIKKIDEKILESFSLFREKVEYNFDSEEIEYNYIVRAHYKFNNFDCILLGQNKKRIVITIN